MNNAKQEKDRTPLLQLVDDIVGDVLDEVAAGVINIVIGAIDEEDD